VPSLGTTFLYKETKNLDFKECKEPLTGVG